MSRWTIENIRLDCNHAGCSASSFPLPSLQLVAEARTVDSAARHTSPSERRRPAMCQVYLVAPSDARRRGWPIDALVDALKRCDSRHGPLLLISRELADSRGEFPPGREADADKFRRWASPLHRDFMASSVREDAVAVSVTIGSIVLFLTCHSGALTTC